MYSFHKNLALRWALLLVIVIGCILRLWIYLQNNCLWGDEISLAISIIDDPLKNMLFPLKTGQQAPVGFLLVTNFLSQNVVGIHEYGIRFFPFLCGIASVLLFPFAIKDLFSSKTTLIISLCLACSYPLIFHSAECKQYSTELFCTILFYYFLHRFLKNNSVFNTLLICFAGIFIQFFSFPSIFIIYGSLAVVGIQTLIEKKSLIKILLLGIIWSSCFVAYYLLYVDQGSNNTWLVDWWSTRNKFVPFPPKSISDLMWYPKNMFDLIRNPLGLSWQFLQNDILEFSWIGCIFLLTGVVLCFKNVSRDKWIYLTPVILTLIASALKLYPFFERLLTFLAPCLFVILGYGLEAFFQSRYQTLKLVPIYFAFTLIINPVFMIINDPFNNIHFREALIDISHKSKPDIHTAMLIQWPLGSYVDYYGRFYSLPSHRTGTTNLRSEAQSCSDFKTLFSEQLNSFSGQQQVWVILNKQTPLYEKSDSKKSTFVGCPSRQYIMLEEILKTRLQSYQRYENTDTVWLLCNFQKSG